MVAMRDVNICWLEGGKIAIIICVVLVLEWQFDRLKGKGLLQDVDLTSGTISVHDLYIEFAELELQGKLDEATDLEHRRWVQIRNGDQLTELERTPSGGCWQKLVRLRINQDDLPPRVGPIGSLEGIEWQFFSNVAVLDLRDLDFEEGTLNLKGLKCLRSLSLDDIWGLRRVEGLEGLKNLSYFYWCNPRRSAGSDMQFPASLRVLHILGRIWLGPDALARCKNLRKLRLQWIRADNLDLSNCLSLQSLTLEDARVPKLQFLTGPISRRCAFSLQSLEVSNCVDLAEISGLDQLIGLERLVLKRCPMIMELLDLQNLPNLQVLELEGPCRKRKGGLELGGMCNPPQFWEPQLQGLPALRRLAFQRCKIPSRLPDLSESRNLEELTLWACEMELCEEDIRMLASLPLLQPVEVESRSGNCVKLDLVRRKVLNNHGYWSRKWEESDLEPKESDLGTLPIKIEQSDDEDVEEESDEEYYVEEGDEENDEEEREEEYYVEEGDEEDDEEEREEEYYVEEGDEEDDVSL
jgi:hypothetical protein